MQKITKNLTICILVLAIISASFLLGSCGQNSGDAGLQSSEKLKFYTYEDSQLLKLIDYYNVKCAENKKEELSIEVVRFEKQDDMLTKISAELMAGRGPDIISFDNRLPYEKLLKQGIFADIEQLLLNDETANKFDLSELNQNALQGFKYDGKQLVMPLFYSTDMLITTKEILEEHNLPIKE
jgi:ABC-type glycerol-3-phosphate transport system substrate-binding protein